ncbi:hypothetical protein F5144DRAFT_321840 [Chaetomium tenue]|uniref:Uncharacterized protein n=1 Tax=Chaetomium tenue TaxID=1854479 RepID=A0ACB7P689_9PEZI|nr:hypothetical protein F5144DRAFT_321840 [Chaetomium globosum]
MSHNIMGTSWMWLAFFSFLRLTPLGAMVRGALMPEGSDFWSSHERRDAAAAAECWSHAGRSFWHPLATVWAVHATKLAHYAFGPAALPENGNPPTQNMIQGLPRSKSGGGVSRRKMIRHFFFLLYTP